MLTWSWNFETTRSLFAHAFATHHGQSHAPVNITVGSHLKPRMFLALALQDLLLFNSKREMRFLYALEVKKHRSSLSIRRNQGYINYGNAKNQMSNVHCNECGWHNQDRAVFYMFKNMISRLWLILVIFYSLA